MTAESTQEPDVPTEDAQSKAAGTAGFLFIMIPVFAVLLLVLAGTNALTAAAHPYTGSGVIISHVPFGTAICTITVKESNGSEYTYQKGGGITTCNPLKDGSKVTIKDGTIMTITAP